jgi:CDP-diacylglycerol--serine O-phosphatidyltransferase
VKVDHERPRRLKRVIPIRVLIPNAITIAALCAGLTSVRLAIAGDFDRAILAIVVAGVLDGIDGRVARLLKGASRFGAELDSLSDVTAFGVAPALVIYLWTLEQLPGAGWIVALACGSRVSTLASTSPTSRTSSTVSSRAFPRPWGRG